MAAVTSSFSFSTLTQSSQRKLTTLSSSRFFGSDSDAGRFRLSISLRYVGVRTSNSVSKLVVRCSSSVSGLGIWELGFFNSYFVFRIWCFNWKYMVVKFSPRILKFCLWDYEFRVEWVGLYRIYFMRIMCLMLGLT